MNVSIKKINRFDIDIIENLRIGELVQLKEVLYCVKNYGDKPNGDYVSDPAPIPSLYVGSIENALWKNHYFFCKDMYYVICFLRKPEELR